MTSKGPQVLTEGDVAAGEGGLQADARKVPTLRLYQGDAVKVLRKLEPESVDLIVTSPPYADQRKAAYGGVHADHYVEWFLPIAYGLHRVLKPTGSFVLNIKERVVDGEQNSPPAPAFVRHQEHRFHEVLRCFSRRRSQFQR